MALVRLMQWVWVHRTLGGSHRLLEMMKRFWSFGLVEMGVSFVFGGEGMVLGEEGKRWITQRKKKEREATD